MLRFVFLRKLYRAFIENTSMMTFSEKRYFVQKFYRYYKELGN